MGLLSKITELQQTTHPQEDWELDERYSKEERTQILSEIDSVMEKNRIQVNAQTFVLKSRKKGWVFPLWVNLGSLLLLVLSFFILRNLFGAPTELDKSDPQALLLTEARLLEEVRKESELLVNQKNQELEEVRLQLKEIEDQKQEIQSRYELDLETLRSRLFTELELALEQEKERLRAQGFAEEEIERRLEVFRKQKEEEVENIIESERKALEEEKIRKEAELNQLYSKFSEELQSLEREKTELEESYNQQLNRLRQEMEERQNVTELELTQAQKDLADLAENQERLNRLKTQISGFYASVQNSLESHNYQEAINTLNLFKSFILEGSYQSVPEMAENEVQDLFLIDSLRAYTQGFLEPESTVAHQAVSEDLSARQEAFNEWMKQAGEHLERGDWDNALAAYSQALDQIADDFGSSELINNLTRLGWEKQSEELQLEQSTAAELWLNTANNLAQEEEWEKALDVYMEHLSETPLARQWDNIPASMVSLYRNWMNQELENQRRNLQTDNNVSKEELDRLVRLNEELGASLDKEIASRQTLEAELDAENRSLEELQNQLELTLDQNGDLQIEIATLGDQILVLQSQISLPEGNNTSQPAVSADQAQQIMALRNQITQMNQEIAAYKQTEELLKRISESYIKYSRSEDLILTESTGSEALISAKGSLNEFLEQEDMEDLLPGFSERLKVYDRAFQQSGEKDITLELADYIFIFSTLQSRDEKKEWLTEQMARSDSDELTEFFENLMLLSLE